MELRGTADAVAVVRAKEVVVEGDVVVVAVVRVVAGWGVGGEAVAAAAARATVAVAPSAISFAIVTPVGVLYSGVSVSSALLGTIAAAAGTDAWFVVCWLGTASCTALSGVTIHVRCWMY